MFSGPLQRARSQTVTTIDASTALIFLVAFAAAITVHEFCHALTAHLLGDQTAQQAGRLTLNPLRHLDPIGTLLPVIAAFYGTPGFGWGRPVPVDPRRMRGGRLGLAAVSAAGPLSNVVLAILAAVVWQRAEAGAFVIPELGEQFLVSMISLNVALAVFNLLPVAPLDGFGIASSVLPVGVADWLARFGPVVLLVLIAAPFIVGVDILGTVLRPVQRALFAFVFTVAGAGPVA